MSKVRKIKMTIKGADVEIRPVDEVVNGCVLPHFGGHIKRLVVVGGVTIGLITPYTPHMTTRRRYRVETADKIADGFPTIVKAVVYILNHTE